MVSKNHWTDARIQSLCGVFRRQPVKSKENVNITSEPRTAQKESSLFLTASVPAQSTPSFTKAVYVKPDLLKVVKRNGVNLTTDQHTLLFQMLSDHDAVFQGGKGYYTGEPVKLRLQPDAVPQRANNMRFRSNFPGNVILVPFVISVQKNMKNVNGRYSKETHLSSEAIH